MLCSRTWTTALTGILCSATLVECRLFTSPSRGGRDCRAGGFGSRFALPLQLSRFLALAIWTSRFGYENGIATIQKGTCSRTKTLDLWIHLVINVLGTLLLGASNYTMQCLSSPTREEIDKAHLRKIPLDIGVPSLGNFAES